jgi:glycosyltransferase involved in cell wall biosynthesis
MNKKISLGVIVPFYNEEKFLEESVSRLLKLDIVDQIILVDDCSIDDSYMIAEKIIEGNNRISLTQTMQNEGKGSAIKRGLELVSTSHVIIHDADLEYFPEDIPELFNETMVYDDCLVIGSRTLGKKERKNIYFYTYFGNKVLTILFSVLNNHKLSDIASCYWLVRVETLKNINLSEKGFAVEVEVLSKFIKNNIQVIEVPIKYEARSYQDGKKIKLKDGLKIFFKILKYCRINIFTKY